MAASVAAGVSLSKAWTGSLQWEGVQNMTPLPHKGLKATKYPGVTKLSDGRWLVLKTWIDPNTGRRIYRRQVVTGTVEDALKVRASLRGQEKNESAQSRPRFKGFVEEWLKRHKAKIEGSTHERYTADVANLNVEFGDWWVDSITYDELERWQSEMSALRTEKGAPQYAPATINGWHRTMRLVLDVAVRRRLLPENPARALSTLPEGRTKGARGTSLSAAHLRAFIDAIPKCVADETLAADVGRGVYVYAWTGMRAGEIIALSWSDVVDGEFCVEHSVWRGQRKTDKTDDPRRITVAGPLVDILEEQRRWLLTSQHAGLASGLVFPANPHQARAGATRRKGDLLWFRSQTTFQDAIAAVCAKADVPRVTPHALRRTFEDLTREAGVEQLVRRAIHGWRSERAQGIYATVRREERDAAASAVVKLVLG